MASFNGRLGAVVLALADVTAALGYTPVTPAQLATKLEFTDNSASWGPDGVRIVPTVHSWTFGDERVQGTTTIFPEGFEFDLSTGVGSSGAFGSASPGGCYFNVILNAHNRVPFGVYGAVTGWEFNATPYVLNNPIYHAGNLPTFLLPANNLSDLVSPSAARSNLGLGSAALLASSAFLQPANNLSDLASATTARSNLGLGSAATQSSSAFAAASHTHAYTDVLSVPTGSLLYRKSVGTGAAEMQPLATLKTDLGLAGTNSGDETAATITTKLNAGGVALTPTSVAATGAVSGSNLSGTNTGDQTITLTGDVTGSGTGSFATTIAANHVTRAMLATTAGATLLGATGAGNVADLTAAQAKTFLAITEADVASLTTDLAAKAPLASPQFTGVTYYQQPAPTAKTTTGTLAIADLLTLIITATSATAVSLTLPTGTLTDAGILSGALAVNEAFEWYLINLGSSSGAVTLVAGTAHTLVGNAVTAISTSSRWLTRKTATNTFVTYRIA